MAIKIKKENQYVYLGSDGLLNEVEKKRADKIYIMAAKEFPNLEEKIKRNKNTDILKIWYARGEVANKLISDFKIPGTEKRYFWLMLYDVSGLKVPDRAKKFHIQNDFHIASILAKYSLNDLVEIGTWSLWHDIFNSNKIMEDERIAEWAVNYILKKKIIKRNNVRLLLKFIRNRLKNLNTKVLSEKEIASKLGEFNL